MAGDSTNVAQGGATVTIGSDLGYIKDGITITPTIDVYFVGENVEQLLTPVKAHRTSENFEIEFTLIEPTLANIKLAWDIDNATAPGPPVTLDFGDNQFEPQERALSCTGIVPGGNGYVRTVSFEKVVLITPAPVKFTKMEETALPHTYRALYDDQTNNRVGQYSDATS